VKFGYTEHGKPFLQGAGSEPSFQFNLSHSGDYTLYAFALERDVGIDVERVRVLQDFESIAVQVFACAERELIACTPRDDRVATFFRLWSRKEAYVKAVGHGLSIPLNEVSVVTSWIDTPDGEGSMHEHPRWYVQDLHCAPSYAAALATQGQPSHITCWRWIEPSM
jgi:4'-phosphopantetheinyl transferase